MNDLVDLRDTLRRFAAERDWDQFHCPKNLAMAVSVEAAELLERFQWMPEEASCNPSESDKSKIRDEIADVLIYLVRLADKLNIELMNAAIAKIAANELKYPIDKAKGSSKKYTEF
jgi:dCTP diphosphatase